MIVPYSFDWRIMTDWPQGKLSLSYSFVSLDSAVAAAAIAFLFFLLSLSTAVEGYSLVLFG